MMRNANLEDLTEIMSILRKTIIEMQSYENNQWDEMYPQKKDFINDIQQGDLYVAEREGRLAAFICVNKIEPIEYNGLKWSSTKDCMVIHRMAVAPECRRKGVGRELMTFAEELAQKRTLDYLKIDTNSVNEKMKALFNKCAYKYIGSISFLGKESPFYCYDKRLV